MLQLIYWLGAFYKTVAVLSLLIFNPQKDSIKFKTEISQGFLWIFLNEAILFFVSFLIGFSTTQHKFSYFQLAQLIMNTYYLVLYVIVLIYLLSKKKQIISQMEILSLTFILFSWAAFFIAGLFSTNFESQESMQNFKNTTYSLAWLLCILKLGIQYHVNRRQSIGLHYIYLICTLCWCVSEAIYFQIQQLNTIQERSLIGIFGITVLMIISLLIRQRRKNKIKMSENWQRSNLQRRFLDDQNDFRDSIIAKKGASTTCGSSIAQTTQNI